MIYWNLIYGYLDIEDIGYVCSGLIEWQIHEQVTPLRNDGLHKAFRVFSRHARVEVGI